MNKLWKYFGFSVLGIFVIFYICFLFVLPNVVKLEQFKPDIQKIAKEQANVTLDFENAKIITTPLFGAGVKINNISVKLSDDSLLFSADSIKTRVALPSIFVLTAKVSCLEINNPFINLEITKNNDLKVIELVEEILNKGKEQRLEQGQTTEAATGWFNPAWIRIKIPCVKINNYKVLVNDLKTKHYLKLTGDELKAGYFNGKVVKLKTYAEVFSDENKNITANVSINTFLPPPAPSLDEEDDPAERIDIPFVNPVEIYRTYDLKTNLDTKLKVREHNGQIYTKGYLNVDDLTLKVQHITLPKSYIHAKLHRTTADIDTNIYVTQNGTLNLLGKVNYGKHPKTDLNIKTSEIKFNDILLLAKAFLNTLQIPHELDRFTATGTLKADCYVKTNFKKLKSSGSVIIKNGGVVVSGIGNAIRNADVNILLDNNVLNIKDSQLFVNNSEIDINGKIDEKSFADINIVANKIPLPMLFNAFAPRELRSAYNFRSADASFALKLNGKLKNAIVTLKAGLDNLYLADKASNFIVQNKGFSTEFFADKKSLQGEITNNGLLISLPQTKSTISAPQFSAEIANKNLTIAENKLNINDHSAITYSGQVINYEKLKSLNFLANGNISTEDLIKLIGREFKPFIHSQGSIPVKVTFDGDKNKQTLFAQILCDKANFITPVDINELQGKNTALQTVADLKGNRIKIKKTGLFTRDITVDEKGNEVITLNEVFGVDGTIAGNTINLIKLTMPKALNGKLFVFPRSGFSVDGRAYIFGNASSPRFRGGFNLRNLTIPELLLDLRTVGLKFRSHDVDFSVEDLLLNGSDLQVRGALSLIPDVVMNIHNLDISSRYMNVDKAMVVSDKAMKYIPASNSAPSTNSQAADIPVAIRNGSINFARIVTGNINLFNTTSRISLARNVFYLNNLRTHAFDGQVNGDISVNLITMLMKIKLNGSNVNVDKAMRDAANMKDMLSGKADFSTDISLKGATYEEQMKSLTGDVNFSVKDGQFGPFGKLENLIIAENIRDSAFFQTALGSIIEGLFTIDTTHFSELAGKISFADGICHLDPITSSGSILALHVFGDYNLLKNYADMKVRARMASLVSNLLGPIGAINPVNLLSNTTAGSMNIVAVKAFSLFCEMVPESEFNILPSFANRYVDNAATKFQIVVRGDVAKPLTLVKSFKWLVSQKEYEAAEQFVSSLPEPIEGSTATTVEEILAEQKALQAEKETVRYKMKSVISKDWADDSAKKEVLKETSKK